jgi:hypothetical protein
MHDCRRQLAGVSERRFGIPQRIESLLRIVDTSQLSRAFGTSVRVA